MKKFLTSLLLSLCLAGGVARAEGPGIGGGITDWGVVVDGMVSVAVNVDNAIAVVITPAGSQDPAVISDGDNLVKVPVDTPSFKVSAAEGFTLYSVRSGDRSLTVTGNEVTVDCTPGAEVRIETRAIQAAIDDVTVDNGAEAVFYNLTGNRVDNPSRGRLYIVVKGGKAGKVIY